MRKALILAGFLALAPFGAAMAGRLRTAWPQQNEETTQRGCI
jgi:hypothetical protein